MAQKVRHLLSLADLTTQDIWRLIHAARSLKGVRSNALGGRVIALLFQKPSMRTRVSFEVAMYQLGGRAIYLSQAEVGLGTREAAEDIARVLSRYVDAIAGRTFLHKDLETLARYASVPVINGLSDAEHPCQALADLQTIYEKKGALKGLTIAFLGDGNNCAASLALGATLVGANFRIASPNGYWLRGDILGRARDYAQRTGAQVLCTDEPTVAVEGADVVYTDVWTSMGQESEAERRRSTFASYQVTPKLLAKARPNALFMHPLPAHSGEEVDVGLLEHPQSVVYDQAENRLHIQKAILLEYLGGASSEVGLS
ncbi:MAG: ornithine carbamoyltransferase [Chloroflexi bacterium]|nr:ornithine carbamoyltransferase [Chloroflexota bacterium]